MAFVHIAELDGTLTIQSQTSGHVFSMPAMDEGTLLPEFLSAFDRGVETLGQLIDKGQAIEADPLLSKEGKNQKLEPLRASTVETIARAAGAVERLDKETSAREAALFAVPGIDPTHTAMAIEDREIRDWLRSMTRGDRLAILQRASATEKASATVQSPWRMLLAMLRSPIPMIDGEMELARDMWQGIKRKGNPAEAVVIDNRRASAEWTRRGLSIVGGLGKVAVGWDRYRVLKQIVTSPNEFARDGYRVFGFDDYAVAQAQERARVEGILKKAA